MSKFSNKLQDAYLGTKAMRVTSNSMSLAQMVLDFDIVELWSASENDPKFHCSYVYATDDIIKMAPGILHGHFPLHQKEHKISPSLCQQSKQSAQRCYWKNIGSGEVAEVAKLLNPKNPPQILTEMCYHITADFQGTNIFIVGFSLSKVLFKASKLKFLDGLVYGIYIASVETTDEEVNSDLVVKSAELDNKEFIPRSASIAQLRQSFESPKSGHSDEFESNEESVGLSLENQSPRGSSQAQTIKSLNQSPIDSFSFPLNKLSILIPASDTMTIDNFKDIKHIADGSNSNICLAKYNNSLVIIKMIKTEAQNDAVAIHEFDIEYSLLTRLSHPNIIKVIGCGKSPRKFIVLEYLKGGTLNTILSYNQAKPGLANKLFRKPTYTYAVLLSKVQDMAEAFQYLHGEVNSGAMIIHRDLKPDNVGFAEDGSLKLFDFGLCTCVRRRNLLNEAYEMTGNTGSLRYMAPEVALRKPYTEKVDVYSFGILVWQMARDRIPFKGLGRDEFMKSVVKGGLRPEVDQTWPAGFQELLQSCWHTDPQARPSFSQIVQQLTMLRDDLTGKSLKKGRSVFGGMKGNSLKMNDDIGSTSLSSDTSNNSNSNRPPQSSWF